MRIVEIKKCFLGSTAGLAQCLENRHKTMKTMTTKTSPHQCKCFLIEATYETSLGQGFKVIVEGCFVKVLLTGQQVGQVHLLN